VTALLVGLGNRDRGDDGVGPVVVGRVSVAGARVVEVVDPLDLLELWAGVDLVVVVDAVRGGRPAGEVVVLEAGAEPLPAGAWAATGRAGTHALGLAAAVELARVLDRLPDRLVVVGVEAAGFEHGAGLSPPVAAAVERAAATVRELLQPVSSP
jgi:hydrogenase maturation protease